MTSPRPLVPLIITSIVALASAAACGKSQLAPRAAPGVSVASITVTSPSFTEGGNIPVDATCDGKDIAPELVFSAPPEGTRSLVVLVDDPDAPSGTFTHMVAFDVAPSVHKLILRTEPAGDGATARFGLNDFGAARYSGPCPPRGELHRYRFRVLALDTALNLPEGAPRDRVDAAMDGHILGEGTLTGQFGH